jgi:L-aspartate oxidase
VPDTDRSGGSPPTSRTARAPAAATRHVGPGDVVTVDVAVVGAGVAGLVAALDLLDAVPHLSVAVLDKGVIGKTGSTPLAQGGMAAAVGPDDSPALHAEDTILAGDGLCDPYAVAVSVAEGPARVRDLTARGAVFDRDAAGALSLAREGGQRVARSVRSADATGAEIFRALRTAATGRVTRLQGVVTELATVDGPAGPRVAGAWLLLDDVEPSPARQGQTAGLALVRGRAVLLATGGCGGLYSATTNRDSATADGVALAWRAGATLVDSEFVQFHPTGLRPGTSTDGGHWRLLLTEALRGAGAVLRDAEGRRFMPERHPDAELAPRHVVTKGILEQSGGAWLDATHLPEELLAHEFPTVLAGARRHGFDLAREPVPVEPVAHYMIGGVATDLHAGTSVPGLWAAGETASTGVHGANRLAGNSLLQSCVFGHRAAVSIAEALTRDGGTPAGCGEPHPPTEPPNTTAPAPDWAAVRGLLRQAMSAGAGPIRSAASLQQAGEALDHAAACLAGPVHLDRVEVGNLVTVGRLIVGSARLRTESRGAHWREDHPHRDPAWDGVRLRRQDVRR